MRNSNIDPLVDFYNNFSQEIFSSVNLFFFIFKFCNAITTSIIFGCVSPYHVL